MCSRSLELMSKAKLKLESSNRKTQYGHQAAILKVTLLTINMLLPIHTSKLLLKFRFDIQSQTKVRVRKLKNPIWPSGGHFKGAYTKIKRLWPMATNNKPMGFKSEIPKHTWGTLRKLCHLQSPDTEKSNLATRRPFWKWHYWSSIGFFPYTQVMCQWSLYLILKAKLKLDSVNRKIQYGW